MWRVVVTRDSSCFSYKITTNDLPVRFGNNTAAFEQENLHAFPRQVLFLLALRVSVGRVNRTFTFLVLSSHGSFNYFVVVSFYRSFESVMKRISSVLEAYCSWSPPFTYATIFVIFRNIKFAVSSVRNI